MSEKKYRKVSIFNAVDLKPEIEEKKVYRKTEIPQLPKLLKFADEEEETDVLVSKYDKERFSMRRLTRASILRWRDDSVDLSSDAPEITDLFANIALKRRSTIVVRPIERFLPTYQLEPKNIFDPLIVRDLSIRVINTKLKNIEFMDHPTMEQTARELSEEILYCIKERGFDRYRIFVMVTFIQKFYQGFAQSSVVFWDSEKDAMASCVYERANYNVTATIFGVYLN